MTDLGTNRAPIGGKPAAGRRLIWLDVARGLALLAMAVYHFTWDLEFFGYVAPGTTGEGGWKQFARSIASSFLFLAGFSLVLGHHPVIRWRAFGRRLTMIVAAALAITVATYIAMPSRFIYFGILHSIAAASVVGLLFLKAPPVLTLIAAIAAILAPRYLDLASFNTPALWWAGLSSEHGPSNDYVPLFPWVGPALLGIAAARIAKSRNWLGLLGSDRLPPPPTNGLAFAGRHSLFVYLAHQPILIGILYIVSLFAPAPGADPAVAYRNNCTQSCAATQSQSFCARFCDCTLEELIASDLFGDLAAGRVDPANDSRTAAIANQCTMEVLEEVTR